MHSLRSGPTVRRVPTRCTNRLTSDFSARTVETVQLPVPLCWRHLCSPIAMWRLLGNLTSSTAATISITTWTPHPNERSLRHVLDSVRVMYGNKKKKEQKKKKNNNNNKAGKETNVGIPSHTVSTRWFSFGNDITCRIPSLPALYISRRHMFAPIPPADSPASHWYARQAVRSVMDYESARELCADHSMSTRRAFVVVGCVASAADRLPAVELLALLPHDERAAAVAQLLSLRSNHHSVEALNRTVDHDKMKGEGKAQAKEEEEEEEEALVQAVLCDPNTTVEDVWMVLRVCVERNTFPVPHWAIAAAKRIVIHSSHTTRSRLVMALSILERAPGVGGDALAEQCESVGLTFEASAYRSNASGPPTDNGEAVQSKRTTRDIHTLQKEPCVRQVSGFGPDMAEWLVQLRGPHMADAALVELETLRSEMSPVVSAYAVRRVALSLTRWEWDNTGMENKSSTHTHTNPVALNYISKAQSVSLPLAAHRLHFAMGLGTVSTARALLPSCQGRLDRIARVMRYTHSASLSLTLDALQAALEAAPRGEYYVILRLQHQGAMMLVRIAGEDTYGKSECTCASTLLNVAEKMRQARHDAALEAWRVATHIPHSMTQSKKDRLQAFHRALETVLGISHTCNASSTVSLNLSMFRRLLSAADTAQLSPCIDVIARSPLCRLRRRVFSWSSHTSCLSSRVAKGEASFPLATLLYRRAAIGFAHLVLSSGYVCQNQTFESHAAVRLAAFAPEIAQDDSLRHALLQAVETLTQHTCSKEKPTHNASPQKAQRGVHQQRDLTPKPCFIQRHQQRSEDTELILTFACVAGALVARDCWEDALRILPPATRDVPPLLRAVRLRAMARSVEFRTHAEMLLEAEVPLQSPMPRRIRCLVAAANLSKAFDWWR